MGYLIKSTGPHTYPIVHDYHQCESCGQVIESRESFEYRLGEYIKDLKCKACSHEFTLKKKSRPSLGPFFNANS